MNTYQKPGFKFVALNTGDNSACYFKATYSWEICGVEVIPGFATVFNDDDACDTSPNDGYVLCQHNGAPNNTVFGS